MFTIQNNPDAVQFQPLYNFLDIRSDTSNKTKEYDMYKDHLYINIYVNSKGIQYAF